MRKNISKLSFSMELLSIHTLYIINLFFLSGWIFFNNHLSTSLTSLLWYFASILISCTSTADTFGASIIIDNTPTIPYSTCISKPATTSMLQFLRAKKWKQINKISFTQLLLLWCGFCNLKYEKSWIKSPYCWHISCCYYVIIFISRKSKSWLLCYNLLVCLFLS